MNTIFCGQQLIKLSSVDSTNNYAANLINEINVIEGTVIMADFQENGKGQRGASWSSRKGDNLLMSLVLHPKFLKISDQFNLSKLVAVSIYEYLSQFSSDVKIKWPNDIYFNGNKISGVLIENSTKGESIKNSIVGIGLNVRQTEFENSNATSLNIEGIVQSREQVLEGLCQMIEKNYMQSKTKGFDEINSIYLNNLLGLNEERSYYLPDGSHLNGKITGVAQDGKLLLKSLEDQEVKQFDLKEISFFPFQP